jgi:hypothetical protein
MKRAWLLSLLLPAATLAQEVLPGAEILPDEAVAAAEVDLLAAETELLDAIRQGVALSIAYCEEANCEPAVSREELSRLVETAEKRIAVLAVRHGEGSEATLEPVLLSYATVRDEYAKYLEQLGTAATEEAPAPEEPVFTTEAPAGDLPPEVFDLFRDVDDPLADDPIPDDEEL